MAMLGKLFFICLVLPLVLSFSVEKDDSAILFDNSMDPFKAESYVSDSPEEQKKVRINWAPVWDDIEASSEMDLKYEIEKENCNAKSGKGLYNLIEQSKKMLNSQQILDVIHHYAQDREVQRLERFLHSPQFKSLIYALEDSMEFKLLQSYTCNILHLDLLHIKRDFNPIAAESNEQSLGGLKGLLDHLISVIPRGQLKQLYKNLLLTDEDLMQSVAYLKSPEFKQLLLNLRQNVPAYKELIDKFKAIGVPIDEIRDYAENIYKV